MGGKDKSGDNNCSDKPGISSSEHQHASKCAGTAERSILLPTRAPGLYISTSDSELPPKRKADEIISTSSDSDESCLKYIRGACIANEDKCVPSEGNEETDVVTTSSDSVGGRTVANGLSAKPLKG
jgi:hypothetical protein